MNGTNEHERARLLLEERALGIINDGDGVWLAMHLARCAECERAAEEMKSAIALLRSEPVTAPTFLVSRTKTRVRIRARELQENADRMRMVWLSVALATIVSSVTLYSGYMAYEAWGSATLFSGRNALLSTMAVIWFWIAPAIGVLAAGAYGRSQWWRGLQQDSSGRGLEND